MALDMTKTSGAKMISNVVKKANQITSDGKKHDIPIEDIVFNQLNEYLFGLKGIDKFAEHIKEDGFHGAIEVFALSNGKYEIFAGHRRFLALKKNGAKSIPCIVNQNVDDIERTKNLIGSNIHTRTLSPLNYARCIEVYKRDVLAKNGFKGDKRKECARYFDISQSQVYRYECITKMIPELQQLCDDSSFPYSAFAFAGNLRDDLQQELYNQVMSYYETTKQPHSENSGSEEDTDLFVLSKKRIEQMINSIKTRDERRKKREIAYNSNERVENIIVNNNQDIADVMDTNYDSPDHIIEKNDNDNEDDSSLGRLDIFIDGADKGTKKNNNKEESENETSVTYSDEEVLIHLDQINSMVLRNIRFKRKDKIIEFMKKIIDDLENKR